MQITANCLEQITDIMNAKNLSKGGSIMAYLVFFYKVQDCGFFLPYDEDPRTVITDECVAVYEDGKIIFYQKNMLEQKVNEKVICENISVTNKISDLIDSNKWKIRFIPRYLGFWAYDGSCDNVWFRNRHFHGISFLSHKKLSPEELKKFIKEVREEKMTDWRKYIRWAKAINKFRDIYDEIRKILIDNGLPEECIWD